MSEIKRLNYFIGQFLTADDFLDEQAYHIGQRRRANRLRFGPGILDAGFLVTPGLTVDSIEVGPGTAIDREGREIVLLDPRTLDIGPAAAGDHYLVVSYQDEKDPADKRKDGDFEDVIRITERVELTLHDAPPAGDRAGLDLVVARITVTVAAGQRQVAIHNDDPQRQPSRLQFSNEGGNKLVVYDTGPTDRYGFGLNSGNLNAFVPAGGRFSLRQNGYDGTEVVSITGGGKVGIGTNSPSAALEIQGPNAPTGAAGQRDISLSFAGAGSAKIRAFRGDSWDTYLQLLTNAGGRLSDNPEVRLHIAQDGKVGIGTTEPKTALHIPDRGLQIGANAEPSKNFHIVADDTDQKRGLRFWNKDYGSGTHLLTILNDGNVGIGTTTPRSKLDVQGDIAVTGTVDGRDLSADGAKLDSHVTSSANPHYTTAAQVGALPLIGGALTGELTVNAPTNSQGGIRCSVSANDGRGAIAIYGKIALASGPTWAGYFEGDVKVTGTVSQGSSRDLKRDIRPLSSSDAATVVEGLEPVAFRWKAGNNFDECLGFIAEDAPAAVTSTGRDSVTYAHIVAALTRFVKDQDALIRALEGRLNEIEARV